MVLCSKYWMHITYFWNWTIPFEDMVEESLWKEEVKVCWTGCRSKGTCLASTHHISGDKCWRGLGANSARALQSGFQFWGGPLKGGIQDKASEKASQWPWLIPCWFPLEAMLQREILKICEVSLLCFRFFISLRGLLVLFGDVADQGGILLVFWDSFKGTLWKNAVGNLGVIQWNRRWKDAGLKSPIKYSWRWWSSGGDGYFMFGFSGLAFRLLTLLNLCQQDINKDCFLVIFFF